MISKKICIVGAFAVGKTSLVRRFVESIFSEKYHTTIGVKISKRIVDVGSVQVLNMIWDIEGADDFSTLKPSYLRGASGIMLVVDGTRPRSVDRAREIKKLIDDNLDNVPVLLLVNKFDLESEWRINLDDDSKLIEGIDHVYYTSAKSGKDVAEAFQDLSSRMIQ